MPWSLLYAIAFHYYIIPNVFFYHAEGFSSHQTNQRLGSWALKTQTPIYDKFWHKYNKVNAYNLNRTLCEIRHFYSVACKKLIYHIYLFYIKSNAGLVCRSITYLLIQEYKEFNDILYNHNNNTHKPSIHHFTGLLWTSDLGFGHATLIRSQEAFSRRAWAASVCQESDFKRQRGSRWRHCLVCTW